MAELENNLETTEVVETMEEGVQPDSKSEKGDSKPVKQGSSDAASIGTGKVEVVKPEENPLKTYLKIKHHLSPVSQEWANRPS